MRFDRINLLGDFRVNGLTGAPGQVLGITQGQIGWINVTSGGEGGGGIGATGPEGPSPIISNGSYQVVFGCGSSITSCVGGSGLYFNKYYGNFASQKDNIFFLNSTPDSNSVSLSTSGASYIDRGFNSVIASSAPVVICRTITRNNMFNSIIGSGQSYIVSGGSHNCYNSIISSCNIKFGEGNSSGNYNSSVISSRYMMGNCLYGVKNSVILSSYLGSIKESEDSFVEKINNQVVISSSRSTIISGRDNCIRASIDSSIIGGRNSFIRDSNNSVIVGSYNSCICNSENTVILGGIGLTAFGFINTTITQRLQKVKKIRLVTSTTPSPLEDGMIWYESDKLWGRINGQTGTFSLVT